MPKAQVLVTVTAEAFVNVPDGVDDIDRFVRDSVSLVWGEAEANPVQAPAISVEYFLIPEPVAEEEVIAAAVETSETAVDTQFSDTLPLPVAALVTEPALAEAGTEPIVGIDALLEDPSYRQILRAAVRNRSTELLESVVDQVVAELEPLLRRHYNKNAPGAA